MLDSGASLRAERLAQLRGLTGQQIGDVIEAIRRASTIPRSEYHFEKHRRQFGVRNEREYLEAFLLHLRRSDLRTFTYLRPAGRVPLWELVAPDTGTTVVYNERRRQVWSFFRPEDALARMSAMSGRWIEVVRVEAGWRLEDKPWLAP